MSHRDSLVLSSSTQDRDEFRRQVSATMDAIMASYDDESAFSGMDPFELRRRIQAIDVLPGSGLGFDDTLTTVAREVLPHMLRTWSVDYMPHLHAPSLMESISSELIIGTYNDSMDSWDQSPAATEVELSVIRCLCTLFGYDGNADGCFTSGGSQSNLSGIIAARDAWCMKRLGHDVKRHGNPDIWPRMRLYTSEISHFSMDKSCHLLGLGHDAVVKLPVDDRCRIDIDQARRIIERDVEAGLLPFCIVATIGTTDFGSVDDIAALRLIADRYGAHLHADAAYGSGAIMSRRYRERIGDLSLADSITVDFHKMFLLPISCSAILVKDASLLGCFELHADYLNRQEDEEDGYVNLVDKSIQTTRRADALKVLISFMTHGRDGYERMIDTVIGNADHFHSMISGDEDFICPVAPTLSSVVFALRDGDEVNRAVRRALLSSGTVIGQTVKDGRVMLKFTLLNPALTHEHIDRLIERIKAFRDRLKP